MLKLHKGIRLESLQMPFRRALQVAARLGVEGIEVNARTEIRPAELTRTGVRHIRKLLADSRLKICCVSFPTRRGYATAEDLDQRLDATRAVMMMAWDLGCPVVSNQIGPIPSDDAPARSVLIEALSDLGRHAQRVGAFLAAQTADNDPRELARLIAALGPAALRVDFDPAALMTSRYDVNEAMDQLAGSVSHFRARDAVRDLSRSENVEVQLGRGSVDFPQLLGRLEECQYGGFITVGGRVADGNVNRYAEELAYLDNVFA